MLPLALGFCHTLLKIIYLPAIMYWLQWCSTAVHEVAFSILSHWCCISIGLKYQIIFVVKLGSILERKTVQTDP